MSQNNVKEDADTLIMRTAISMVDKDGVPVIVVAQDTEILVSLWYHKPQDCVNLYLQAG